MKTKTSQKLLTCFLLITAFYSTGQEQDNNYSTHELKDTYLFFLHREAILKDALDRNQNGVIDLNITSEFLKVYEVLLPYIGHLERPTYFDPDSRVFDDYLFKSIVFYDVFHSKINRSGRRNNHEVFPLKESLNYLDDLFVKQRMPSFLSYDEELLSDFYQYDFSFCDLCEVNNASVFCFLCDNYDVSTLNSPSDIDSKYFTNNYLNFLARAEGCSPDLQSEYADMLGLANGNAAEIGTNANTGISQRGIKINPGNYQVMLHSSAIWEGGEDCTNCLVLGVQLYDDQYNLITDDEITGLTPPTADFPFYTGRKSYSIHDDQVLSLYFSDFYPNWDEKCFSFNIPSSEVAFMDFHLFTPYNGDFDFQVGKYPRVFLDDIYLGTNNGVNLLEDSQFLRDKDVSPWERMYLERDKAVYRDQTPFVSALDKSIQELNLQLGEEAAEPFKIILTFPHISEFKRTSDDLLIPNPFIEDEEYFEVKPEYQNQNVITYYFNQIQRQFKKWKKKNRYGKQSPCPIEIAGIYLASESLPTGNSAYNNYIKYIKKEVEARGWVLTASPYSQFSCQSNSPELGFRFEGYEQHFDYLWQQPNSFSKRQPATGRQVVDRDILQLSKKLIDEKEIGIMMEYNQPKNQGELKDPYHPYHRFHDYLDYSLKYHSVNNYSAFADDEGGFYNLAVSRLEEKRDLYDKLHSHLKKSDCGTIPNPNFEHFEDKTLQHWIYFTGDPILRSDSILKFHPHSTSSLHKGAYSLSCGDLSGGITSPIISVKPNSTYELKAQVKNNSSGCVFGLIRLLNKNKEQIGFEIIGNASESDSWVDYTQLFTTPSEAYLVELVFFGSCDILVDNINLSYSNSPDEESIFNQVHPMKMEVSDTVYTNDIIPITNMTDSLLLSWSAKYHPTEMNGIQQKNYSLGFKLFGYFENPLSTFAISNSDVQNQYYYFNVNQGGDYKIEDNSTGISTYTDGPWIGEGCNTDFTEELEGDIYKFNFTIDCQNQSSEFEYISLGASNYCDVCFPQIGMNCSNQDLTVLENHSPYSGLNTWWTNQSTYNEFKISLQDLYTQGARGIQPFFFQNQGEAGDLLTIHHPQITVIQEPLKSESHTFYPKLKSTEENEDDLFSDSNHSFRAFPNPASDEIQLTFSALQRSESSLLQLHDLTGKLTFSAQINLDNGSKTIDTSSWQSGSYIISLSTENYALERKKILIIH